MIDTKPLEQQIMSPAAQVLELDDPAIHEILALAEHNDYKAAAEQAQKLWERGIYDVRTLGCYLAGVFVERGLSSLPIIMDCLLRALTLNWEYLGPKDRKQRLCDVSLRWLFSTLYTQIDFYHRAKGETWERWNQGWTQVSYKETVDRCVQLAMLLQDTIPGARCHGPLLSLQSMLDGIIRPSHETAGWKAKMATATQIPAPDPPPDPAEKRDSESSTSAGSSDDDSASRSSSGSSSGSSRSSSPASESGSSTDSSTSNDGDADSDSKKSSDSSGSSDDDSDSKEPSDDDSDSKKSSDADDDSDSKKSSDSSESADDKKESDGLEQSDDKPASAPSPAVSPQPAIPPPAPTGQSTTLPLSPALRALMSQLDGFVMLAQKGQLAKAAILYRQIQQSIQHFDPRFYLPSLFGPFYAQVAKQGARLEKHLKSSADFGIEALIELSRVDLELFLNTEIEE